MKPKLISFILAVGFLPVCAPVFAHHGGSQYDQDHPITLKGTVTEFYWANPHCQIFLDAKDENGRVTHWGIETLAPAVIHRAGWTPETLHPGDQITITFAPSKKGTPIGMVRRVVLPNGKELTGGQLGEQPPEQQPQP